MDNHNDTGIVNEASTVQEEIEKRIKLAREVLSGDRSSVSSILLSPHAAISGLKTAIEMGSSEAKALLAGYYYNAKGEDQNYEEALRLATEAAEEGDPEGQSILGRILFEGRAAERDFDRAFTLLSEAAEKGVADAQYLLGTCYYDGNGTEKDLYKARQWLSEANRNGHALAAASLKGIDRIISDKESMDTAAAKAEDGDLDSMISLGKECYKKAILAKEYDPELYAEAEKWLMMAAKRHDAECQYLLYECYTADERNTKNPSEKKELQKVRAHWLEEAAIFNKYPEALYTLSNHRLSGTLIGKNPELAVRYLEYAAGLGHADSMSSLSHCYENGTGVEADIDKAIEWAREAYAHKPDHYTFDDSRVRELREKKYKIEKQKEAQELAEKLKLIEKANPFENASYLWSDISFNVYGILAAAALCLLMLFYRALGSGLFGRPLINVHGLGGLLLKAICFAGIYFGTFVSLLSLLSPIGLEFFAAYPGALMVLALAVGIKENSQFYRWLSYAAGAVMAINLLIVIIKLIRKRK